MGIQEFLLYITPIFILELLAAISGSFYLKKISVPLKNTRFLVGFLWFTVFAEIIGSYAPIGFFTEYRWFSFVKDTMFANNFWWYNLVTILNFGFFTYYFSSYIRDRNVRRLFFVLIVGFFTAAFSYYFVEGKLLFTGSSGVINVAGTLLLLTAILVFYFQLLRSDLVLKLKFFLPFYISVGVLIFNLIVTPIEQLSKYLIGDSSNEFYLDFYFNIVKFANIILYLSFIIGFLICSRKKQFLF